MQRRKILKTILALALILALVMALAACGKKTEEPAQNPTEAKYKIGVNTWGSGAEAFDWHGDEALYVLNTVFGMEANRVSDEFTPDGTLKNVNNFVSAGVDGILMTCNQPSVLPTVSGAAANAKIPFVLGIFVGDPPDRQPLHDSNDFFGGAAEGNTYDDGYTMGKAALADGCKTAVILGGNLGDRPIDTRIDGFTLAFQTEGGGTVLDIARCDSPAEGLEKATALLSANRDADCIYGMVGDYAPGCLGAMEALGLTETKVYVSHAGSQTAQYIKEGKIAQATGGHDLAMHLAACMLINKLDGHPILAADGKPVYVEIKPFVLNQSNIDQFIRLFHNWSSTGNHVLSPTTLKNLLWRYNENVSYKDYEAYNSITLDKLENQTW